MFTSPKKISPKLSRRQWTLAAAAAAMAPAVAGAPARAESADETALSASIEDLRLGLMNKDKAKLEAVTAETMSYGHSAGKIETKAEFVAAVMAR